MTREELKAKLDAMIGMDSELEEKNPHQAELHYKSLTGALLFSLHITDYTGFFGHKGWGFGGMTSALPEMWHQLANVGREG